MQKITKAILDVMKEVKGIEKDSNVGSGSYAYKGVSDQNVKQVIGKAMQKNGLTILPIGIEPKTTTSRWEETNSYGTKQKQSTFTEVITKYLLLHESGESIELSGYGHGVDNQDKGAGKATTYALKYTLLYTFLVPTGQIDDTDSTHSEEIKTKPKKKIKMIEKSQTDKINELVKSRGRTMSEVCKIGKIKSIKELSFERASKLIKYISDLPEATLQ